MNTIKVVGVSSDKQYGEEINISDFSPIPKSEHRPEDELFDELIERVEEAHFVGNEDARIVKSSGEEFTIVNKKLAREFFNDNIYDITLD